ncbi:MULTISPECIES: HAD domain-containing protein [unclassified Paraburkholderia]|uniref:HAD domain-containing protein n=1 Tax=unclassified Paraburkholderia TaxID=2615204 RepID=UPI00161BE126|nr:MULTISPECIES: HAD domain-containing protein [unclassified Paraburkholderia]MBB5442056.1 hypothetical protein [Paraburkholderia sp. WSM4177]MBB5482452.1 hypothetical protein [Paraburkholderia sp. WSM4180]
MAPNAIQATPGASTVTPTLHIEAHRRLLAPASAVGPGKQIPSASAAAAPTLFVDFDGTLHIGHASMDEHGEIALDTGRPLFEFAPLLADLLEPYPEVVLVLTTSWLMTLNTKEVTACLPLALARRVVGTTRDIKPRLSYLLNGMARTYVITSYAYGASLTKWLAIDDSVYGADRFGREPGELAHHFVLLDSAQGLGDSDAQQRVKQWLKDVRHKEGG